MAPFVSGAVPLLTLLHPSAKFFSLSALFAYPALPRRMNLSASKFRIPRLAVAALVLGACGEDDSKAGIDVSEPRVRNLAEAACKQYAECEPDYFSENYENQADCVASYQSEFDDLEDSSGKACLDAYLDWGDCAFVLACDVDEDRKCVDQYAKVAKLCEEEEEEDEEEEEEEETSSAKNAGRFPGRRIPR
jgi:hypothetical protein